MSQEKCNFHHEEHEQVWTQIRNCHNEEDEILDDLVRKDGIAPTRNKEPITEEEAFVFISRKEFQRPPEKRLRRNGCHYDSFRSV